MSLELNPHTGLLPPVPQFHDATLNEVKKTFVDDFCDSQRRGMIWQAYVQHKQELLRLIGVRKREQWLDGSFTTAKEEPCDVDFVTFVPPEVSNSVPQGDRACFEALFQGPDTHPDGLVDAYSAPLEIGENGQETQLTRHWRCYWRKVFGHERSGEAKGIVRTWIGEEDE